MLLPDLLTRGDRSSVALEIDGEAWTYERLNHESNATARALLADGVRAGDRVLVAANNSHDGVATMLGVSIIGGIAVLVPPRWKVRELGYVVRTTQPRAVFVDPSSKGNDVGELVVEALTSDGAVIDSQGRCAYADNVTSLVAYGAAPRTDTPYRSYDEFVTAGSNIQASAVRESLALVTPETPCHIQFTSGTTAWPKGVVVSHSGLMKSARRNADRMGLEASSRYFTPQPFYYTGGLTIGLLSGLYAGAATYSQRFFDAGRALATIEDARITHHGGVASMYTMELEHEEFRKSRMRSLTFLRTTGTPAQFARFRNEIGARPTNAYGMTELCATVAMASHLDPIEWAMETCGRPMDGVQIRILGQNGEVVEPEVSGEIVVSGDIMLGYWGGEEPSWAELDEPGRWLRTGDHGLLDGLGRLHFLGRLKSTIRVGGQNVSPLEVEDVLIEHPAVSGACVVGVPDERLDEVVAAAVVTRTSITGEELIGHCKQRMASYKAPRVIRFVDDLPLTPGGKVDYRAVLESMTS